MKIFKLWLLKDIEDFKFLMSESEKKYKTLLKDLSSDNLMERCEVLKLKTNIEDSFNLYTNVYKRIQTEELNDKFVKSLESYVFEHGAAKVSKLIELFTEPVLLSINDKVNRIDLFFTEEEMEVITELYKHFTKFKIMPKGNLWIKTFLLNI